MATLYITLPERHRHLANECEARGFKSIVELAPGCCLVQKNNERVMPVYALQCAPRAEQIPQGSIKETANWITARLSSHISKPSLESSRPWALHCYSPTPAHIPVRTQRARLIESALIQQLKHSHLPLPLRAPQNSAHLIAQVISLSPELTYFSMASSDQVEIVPTLAGRPFIETSQEPPSRAYLKLSEALATFRIEPRAGDTAIDLGASPGGWTWRLLQSHLKVAAVDRAPLDPLLMKNPNVTFHKGDAFQFLPPAPVSWMVCDVIAYPEATLDLVQSWLEKKWCESACVTLKFKGDIDYRWLIETERRLKVLRKDVMLRQLVHNKNEATILYHSSLI